MYSRRKLGSVGDDSNLPHLEASCNPFIITIDPNFRPGTSKSSKKRPKRPTIFLNLYQTGELSWSFITSSISFILTWTPSIPRPFAPPISRAPQRHLKIRPWNPRASPPLAPDRLGDFRIFQGDFGIVELHLRKQPEGWLLLRLDGNQRSGVQTSWGKGSWSHYLQGFVHSWWL